MKGSIEFKNRELADKIDLMDVGFPDVVASTSASELYSLLKYIILDPTENAYLRRTAIQNLTECVFLNRLNIRQELTILIDEWKPDETFIEVRRLKDLSFFHDSAENEIEQVFKEAQLHDKAEIAAEGFFQGGLIELQKSLKAADKNESLDGLQRSISAFETSTQLIENRVDAKFFLNVSHYLTYIYEGRPQEAELLLSTVEKLMFEMEAFSFAKGPGPLLVSFYNSLSSLRLIRSETIAEWLDYRKGFERLFVLFNAFQASEVDRRLSEGSLHDLFTTFLESNVLNPFFSKSFAADQARINVALQTPDMSTAERSFMELLKDLTKCDDLKKTSETATIREALIRALPNTLPQSIDRELGKVKENNSPSEYVEIFHRFSGKTHYELRDSLIWAATTLQKDIFYRDATENQRNTQIANLLDGRGFRVKDQTLRGSSHTGVSAGEIDVFIEYPNGLPMSVIEALILSTLDKAYTAKHLDKIFNYDTAGNHANYIVVYSEANNFGSLWTKYVEFVKSYDFVFTQQSFEILTTLRYSDLRFATGKHDRNGTVVSLVHMMVNMAK